MLLQEETHNFSDKEKFKRECQGANSTSSWKKKITFSFLLVRVIYNVGTENFKHWHGKIELTDDGKNPGRCRPNSLERED